MVGKDFHCLLSSGNALVFTYKAKLFHPVAFCVSLFVIFASCSALSCDVSLHLIDVWKIDFFLYIYISIDWQRVYSTESERKIHNYRYIIIIIIIIVIDPSCLHPTAVFIHNHITSNRTVRFPQHTFPGLKIMTGGVKEMVVSFIQNKLLNYAENVLYMTRRPKLQHEF